MLYEKYHTAILEALKTVLIVDISRLATITGFSRPTIRKHIPDLLDAGLLAHHAT